MKELFTELGDYLPLRERDEDTEPIVCADYEAMLNRAAYEDEAGTEWPYPVPMTAATEVM